jgi:predicted deacylase
MPLPTGVTFIEPTIPAYVFDAKEPGPTALIQGAIHGNEIAGAHALFEYLEEGLVPDHGRLILIPVMNPAAYRARLRAAPGGLDLNRVFPGDADSPEKERRLAAKFMALVEDEKPALMATLHESLKRFHPEIPASFGQTLVYGVEPMPPVVQRVVDRMNQALQNPYELWAPHYYPVATSSTEVIVDRVGCIGICVETWEVFDERRRIDMQKDVVRLLLEEVGVLLPRS